MSRPVLFTSEGERVPVFVVRNETSIGKIMHSRYGWKTVRTWEPGYVAERWGSRHWRLWEIAYVSRIDGSVNANRLDYWHKTIVHPIRRWPTLAAIEMKLRHLHERSRDAL